MDKGNGYVKWVSLVTVAVALFAIFASVSLFAFSQAIDIDKRAKAGIEVVDAKSNARFTENRLAIIQMMKENAEAHLIMMGDLREIKAKMGISK